MNWKRYVDVHIGGLFVAAFFAIGVLDFFVFFFFFFFCSCCFDVVFWLFVLLVVVAFSLFFFLFCFVFVLLFFGGEGVKPLTYLYPPEIPELIPVVLLIIVIIFFRAVPPAVSASKTLECNQ